jgi:protein TonB
MAAARRFAEWSSIRNESRDVAEYRLLYFKSAPVNAIRGDGDLPERERAMRWLAVACGLFLFLATGLYLIVAAQSLMRASAGAGVHRADTIITVHLQPAVTPVVSPPVSTAHASEEAQAPASRLPTTPAAIVQAAPALKLPEPTEGRDGKERAPHAAAHRAARQPAVAIGGVASAFQSELLAHIEQYRLYPTAAVPGRLEGVVQVLFAMDRDGEVTGVWVKTGSGYDVLDEAAMKTVWRAEPLPPIPPGLPSPLTVMLPVSFSPP